MAEKEDPMLGRTLHGTILLRRKIGSGGMGHVYEGYQEHLDRVVAVKVLTPEHARNPIAAEYFLREARSASGLRHPNIIQIIDYGKEEDGTLFMAMEYVPGKPLGRIIRKDFPLSTERIVAIIEQTLAGLIEAHRKELVHRDLKPDNLMVETIDGRDFVKILDFGIAQSRAPERVVGPLTRQGAVVGTPQYMSPEQASGDTVDPRSDLFSLGVILYEMLTQKVPFNGKNLPEILISVIRDEPTQPSALRTDLEIDPGLEAICLRAMKKERDVRYQSAEDFREALRSLSSPAPEPAKPAAPAQFVFRPKSRKQRALGADTMLTKDQASEAPSAPAGVPVAPTSAIEPPQTPAPEHDTHRGSLGFDIGELRGNLLGERMGVVALVLHQRSERRIDAETLIELRQGIDKALDEVATQWGGVVQGRQGTFATIIFGIPSPRADDALRAAQATLQLRHRLGKLAPDGTTFSFALAAGEIFCPDGNLTSAAGPPIDDATEAVREAGEENVLIASDELASELDAMFRLAPLTADGHRALIGVRDAAAVVEERTATTADLVGRDHEIATVLGVLGRLSQRKGGVLPILGEPGVGKTAVLDELTRLADARAFRVARVRARWSGPELVRWVRIRWLMDLLRQHGRLLDEAEVSFREMGVDLEYARLLAGFVNGELEQTFGFVGSTRAADVEADAERALRVALRQAARAVTRERPLLIVIDDIDGFEGAFAEEIRAWTEFAVHNSLLIAFASRTGTDRTVEEFPSAATPIELHPLDDDAARAFLKVRLKGKRYESLIGRLVRVGAGLPLNLEQLARHAVKHPDMTEKEVEEWLASSRDVSGILKAQLFGQEKSVQNVLALLSALGDGVLGSTVMELASADWNTEEALAHLYDSGLITIEGEKHHRIYFRPPSFRHVVYDRLSRRVRGRIHARAAAHHEERLRASRGNFDRDDLIALAYHREGSGDHNGALEALYSLVDRSLRSFEFEIARTHLKEAGRILRSSFPDEHEKLARIELQLIRTDVATGRRAEAIDRCRTLDRSEKLSPQTTSEVRIQLAELWLEEEDPDLVEQMVRKSLGEIRRLQASRPKDITISCLLVRALQTMATCHERGGRLVQAAKFALEAAELIERGDINPSDNPYGPSIVWETLNQLGRIRLRNKDLPGAQKMFELALRVVSNAEDRRGELAVRANVASLLAAQGELDLAQRSLSAALRVARRLSDPRSIARLEHNRGLLLVRQKRLEASRDAFQASLDLSEDLDWREGIAMNVDRLRFLEAQLEGAV